MLGTPVVYWDVRSHAEYWRERFAHFDDMNLGPVPPVPEQQLARGIPEPVLGATLAAMCLVAASRRRRVEIPPPQG
jgi:hypothetical protein